MPGIGNADYPELVASKAFDIVERVGRENVKTASGLAAVMGLKSPDSGYFYHQVSSLTKFYGLVERTRGSVALTPLGERIAHPLSDEDKRRAQGEAIRRVALLSALYERLGSEFHESDFRTILRDVTQAPLADIERAAPGVEGLYKDAQRYLSGVAGPRPVSDIRPASRGASEDHAGPIRTSGGPDVLTHEPGYRVFQGDGVYLKIKKDKDALEEALTTIQGWLKRHTPAD
jgi:hypothetical protein